MSQDQTDDNSATTSPFTVRQAIAAIKAEHHLSETAAYAMLIRTKAA